MRPLCFSCSDGLVGAMCLEMEQKPEKSGPFLTVEFPHRPRTASFQTVFMGRCVLGGASLG